MFEDFSDEGLEKIKAYVNNSFNPLVYLSIDPGESNGVTAYDEKAYLQLMVTVPWERMTAFLEIFENVNQCVYEDYRMYPQKTKDHIYSDLKTTRVIGRIESWSERKSIPLIKQGAHIKKTAYLWLGKKSLPKSNPKNHEWDAHAHFTYWAVQKKLIDPAELLKRDSASQRKS